MRFALPYFQTPDTSDHNIVASLEDQFVITLVQTKVDDDGQSNSQDLSQGASWEGPAIVKVYKFSESSLQKIEKVNIKLECQSKPYIGYLVDNGKGYLAVGCESSKLKIYEILNSGEGKGKAKISSAKLVRSSDIKSGPIEAKMFRTLGNTLVFYSQEGSKHNLKWITPSKDSGSPIDLGGKPSYITLHELNGVVRALCVVNDTLVSISNGNKDSKKVAGKNLLHVAAAKDSNTIYALAQTQGTKKLSAMAFEIKADGTMGEPTLVDTLKEVLFQDDDLSSYKLALLKTGSKPTLALINGNNQVFRCTGASPKFDVLVDENYFEVIDVCSQSSGGAFVVIKNIDKVRVDGNRSIFAIAAISN